MPLAYPTLFPSLNRLQVSALRVEVLLVEAQRHVGSRHEMSAVGLFPADAPAAGYATDESVLVGIAAPDVLGEYAVEGGDVVSHRLCSL